MPDAILDRILAMLDENGVSYRHLTHEPTPTSADAARVRGVPLAIGGKALVIKADDRFVLVVFSAARKLDSGALRRELGARKSRFARPEELMELTGLVPGSVPPFGEPILPLPLFVDASVFHSDEIAFNAGSLTNSVIMPAPDYRRLVRIERIVAITKSD